MAVSPRLIKRRIRSVSNTRKITKAMELVAASKMRKAVQLTVSSREYSRAINAIVEDVRKLVDSSTHPLLVGRLEPRASLVIVASSDRGLCGGFNAQLLKKTFEFFATRGETIQVVTVGKRAELAVKRTGHPIVAAFEAISNAPSFERSRPVGNFAFEEFMHANVDRVFMVYTDFRSALSQIPTVTQLLPITPENELALRAEESAEDEEEQRDQKNEGVEHAEAGSPESKKSFYWKRWYAPEPEYAGALFEPSTDVLLENLLPRLIEIKMYQALLESSASEQAARMLAMRNATESATEMIDDLTLSFNQARQANITREISEISAGKASLE